MQFLRISFRFIHFPILFDASAKSINELALSCDSAPMKLDSITMGSDRAAMGGDSITMGFDEAAMGLTMLQWAQYLPQ